MGYTVSMKHESKHGENKMKSAIYLGILAIIIVAVIGGVAQQANHPTSGPTITNKNMQPINCHTEKGAAPYKLPCATLLLSQLPKCC